MPYQSLHAEIQFALSIRIGTQPQDKSHAASGYVESRSSVYMLLNFCSNLYYLVNLKYCSNFFTSKLS